MTKIIIDPITRVSGLLNLEVQIENNKIIDAKVSGSQFRGFEKMFEGRSPFEVIRLVSRVCGICSTHHAYTSVRALENAMNITPDYNGKVARDIANGFEFLQNYLRHIYFFVFPDYVDVININPLFKKQSKEKCDYRLSEIDTKKINEHYLDAVKYSREAHKALAVLAGKAPHCHGIWIGGITTIIDVPQIESIKYLISTIKDFIVNNLIEDIQIISKTYSDYYNIGKGHGNLMSYGLYNDYDLPIKYVNPSVRINGIQENLDINNITECITNSWKTASGEIIIPGKDEVAAPNPLKTNGYSFVDAPRYKGEAMEVGALARMTLSGEYKGNISTMDRLVAKVYEAKKVCEIIEALILILKEGSPNQKDWKVPENVSGVGLSEAERGSLAHWVSIKDSKISNYTLIPPTTWNLSPMDNKGVKGTVEQALIGTEIKDASNPIEIGRIVRSFDPCLNCAAHITSDKYEPIKIIING
ncbi:MAG: nickel-dependent hydrogenase large subunit [Clostridium sp.]|uniref:nickel-dependent hydrogenase large subunit n=1 Tax=Clostridium sp. TaxID=1506 RepID=UPI003F3A5CB1